MWAVKRLLLGATSPGQSWPESNDNERYSAYPDDPALQAPHHQIV